jgi:hypothetical protein
MWRVPRAPDEDQRTLVYKDVYFVRWCLRAFADARKRGAMTGGLWQIAGYASRDSSPASGAISSSGTARAAADATGRPGCGRCPGSRSGSRDPLARAGRSASRRRPDGRRGAPGVARRGIFLETRRDGGISRDWYGAVVGEPFLGTHQTRAVADLVDRLWLSHTRSVMQRQGAR